MQKLAIQLDKLINFARKFPLLNKFPVRFYRFVFVGLSVFALDFTILRIMFDLIKLTQPVDLVVVKFSVANMISTFCGIVFGYIANRTWSFENKSDNVASQFGKYVGVAIFNFILNNLLFGFLFYNVFAQSGLSTQISSSISKVLATSFQVVTSYLGYKYIVFREDKEVISEATIP